MNIFIGGMSEPPPRFAGLANFLLLLSRWRHRDDEQNWGYRTADAIPFQVDPVCCVAISGQPHTETAEIAEIVI